jgi:DNA-directed RNA polymerase specialized sigma24 family protein
MNRPSPGADPEEAPAAVLYRHHGPLIFAWLLKHTQSWEDAEDLLLEVFLAALEHQRLLAVQEEKRRAWLLGVAQHKQDVSPRSDTCKENRIAAQLGLCSAAG